MENTTFWITGHSRGAAISNLLSQKITTYGDYTNPELYTYAFATPNAVQSKSDILPLEGVFNVVNQDDLVPDLPLSAAGWDYKKYGTILDDVKVDEEGWKKLAGQNYHGNLEKKNDLVNAFHRLIPTVPDAYRLPEPTEIPNEVDAIDRKSVV